jgi:hypothetical protein
MYESLVAPQRNTIKQRDQCFLLLVDQNGYSRGGLGYDVLTL